MTRATCSVSTCTRVVAAVGYCHAHYYRWKKHGDPRAHIPLPPKPEVPCSVDPCDRIAESNGMCSLHDARTRRTGEPMAGTPPLLRRSTCSAEGCETKHHSNGWCEMHYQRMKRNGSLELAAPNYATGQRSGMWRGDEVTYKPAHFRVIRLRGSASLHLCANCGG